MFVFFILIFLKSSSGQSFTDINAGLPGLLNSQSLDWGDYDNDGDLDLLLAGQFDTAGIPRICLICRYDSGIFTKLTPGVTPLYYASTRWIDYDIDGDLDFLYSGRLDYNNNRKTFLYENVNAIFTEHELFDTKCGFIEVGDFDNDGDMDVAMSGANESYEYLCLVYRNDSNVIFTDVHADIDSIQGYVTWGDYDNDGDLDILIAGNEGIYPFTTVLRILRNENLVSFTEMDPQLYVQYGDIAIGDYDGDGDPDFAISGPNELNGDEYTSRIYNNAPFTSVEILKNPCEYSLYPNPVKSTVSIRPEKIHNWKTDVFIYSISGELMKNSSFYGDAECCVNLDGLIPGIYTVILVDENKSYTFKILKE